jgi:hypothetical protein
MPLPATKSFVVPFGRCSRSRSRRLAAAGPTAFAIFGSGTGTVHPMAMSMSNGAYYRLPHALLGRDVRAE